MELFLKIDKFNHFENIPLFLQVSKSLRTCIFRHADEIIEHLLSINDSLPKWCYLQIPLIFPTLYQKIESKVKIRIPSFIHLKSAFLAGGSICKFAFDKEWLTTDYDIFVEDKGEPEYKRVKIYLEDRMDFLDLVFKNESISGFDISVCQIGMNLNTRVIYVTPLFLYSFLRKKMVIRVSDLSAQYYQDESPLGLDIIYERHLKYHTEEFHKCSTCKYTVDNVLIDSTMIKRWFERVKKYLDRFNGWEFKFVK
jgi:hypothetical protein